jgi:methylmalonyl-CoA mutase N-terminal domain/subunit
MANDTEPTSTAGPPAKVTTNSGLPVEECYSESHLTPDLQERLGEPGTYPFTRGPYPGMYRKRLWTMRQYAGFGTAQKSNERYRYLLEQGQTGLSVAFDLPTQIGYDSDHPMAEGEVGKVGVAIDSLADMERLFQDIPLDRVSTSMTINATAAILLAFYITVARKQGVQDDQISGTVQNDILKEYIARGTYIYPPAPSLRLVTDVFRYTSAHLPRFNSISISGYHIREAGATAVQELAFTLADAICYVERAMTTGLDVDEFAPRLSFFLNGHNDFFEEVAKFRAARRIWARIMKERFGAKNPKSWLLRFHTQTAGSMLTAQQPDNNVVRVTVQALAAVLGGTQSLHTNASDEALGLPTEHSAQVALRTQQVLAYESGVTRTADPMAGSYYVESLTDEIEKRVQVYLEEVDKMGGALKAVETGYFQREIQKSAYDYQKRVDDGSQVVVGVNQWASTFDPPDEALVVDPSVRDEQSRFLSDVKAGRQAAQVEGALAFLAKAAQRDVSLMEPILACAEAYCTVGEISDVLRAAWGEYTESVVI